MRVTILTLFPEMFSSFLASPVTRRAIAKGKASISVVDIKDYAKGSFRKIDDSPYGGGPGMVIRVDTLKNALDSVRNDKTHTVLMSTKGRPYTQSDARRLASMEDLVIVCGHYEGIDARFESYIDEQVSVGDYILTGGELPAMTVCDSIVRLLDDVLRDGSADDESFENGLLEYPHYTHPAEFDGQKVPDVLLSGNAREIASWRLAQSILLTAERRPDMLGNGITSYGSMVLKVQDANAASQRECDILQWLSNKTKVPKVLGHVVSGGKDFLLMEKTKGKTLCDPSILSNRNRLMKTVDAALRMLWEIDISDWPFEKPEGDDLVFSHGDLRLENMLADCSGITGFINVGNACIATKQRDIECCTSSIKMHIGA